MCLPVAQMPLHTADGASPLLWAHVGGRQRRVRPCCCPRGWHCSLQGGLTQAKREGISPARQSEGLCPGTPGIALGCLCSLHEKTRRVHSPSGMCLGASGWGRRQAPCGEASCLSAFCLSQASDNWLPKEGGEVPGVPGRTWCQVGRCQHWGRTGSPPGAPPCTCHWGQRVSRGAWGGSMRSTGNPGPPQPVALPHG